MDTLKETIKAARRDYFGAYNGNYWKAQKVNETTWSRVIGARISKGKCLATFLNDGKEHEIRGLSCIM
jgi:hypothetical protein